MNNKNKTFIMEETKHKFEENINEVIKPGGETDFTFFVQLNDGRFEQKTLPAFMKNSFISSFADQIPNEIEFNYWYKEAQEKFNNNESEKPLSL